MLVLTLRKSEFVHIGPTILVTLVEVRGDKARIGFTAPDSVAVHRDIVWEMIMAGVDQTDLVAVDAALQRSREEMEKTRQERVAHYAAKPTL